MKNFNHRKILFFAIIIELFVMTGCKVEFSGTSHVNDCGDIERTTIYRADDISDKKEFGRLYGLPSGGNWKEEKETENGKEKIKYVYQITRSFPLKQQPGNDFIRFNETHTRFAKNSFAVEVKDLWFIKWFKYHERFQDIQNKETVEKVLNGLLDVFIVAFRNSLSSKFSKEETESITSQTTIYYKNILEKIFSRLFNGSDINDDLWQKLEKEISPEEVKEFLIKQFPDLGSDNSRKKTLEGALKLGTDAANKYWNEESRQSLFFEALQGVYGFQLFQSYPFIVQLILPGKIKATNGTNKNGQIYWEFDANGFGKDLFAFSRKIYWNRVGSVGLAVLFLFFIIALRLKRTQPL